MKRLIHTFTVLFLLSGTASLLQAQAPSAIPYQAVARNSSGNLMVNQIISVRFSIREASVSGTIVYQETHGVTTNALGLFVVNIGQGIPVSGTFSTINWASGAKFTQVEIDATGGTSYTDMGTQQMLSVPYALYASSGGTPPAAGTGISVTGTTITNTAPDQTVTLTGSGATTVTGTYPNFTVSSTDANTTYSGGTGINVSGTTITNTAPDQTVTLTGSGATTVTGAYPNFTVSSTDANTTYSGGTGINVSGTTITNTAPDQTVTLTGGGITTVTGTYPNFSISSSETDPQVSASGTNRIPKWNGSTLADGLLYDNGTSIGLGTTSPSGLLDLQSSGTAVMNLQSSGSHAYFRLRAPSTSETGFQFYTDNSVRWSWGKSTTIETGSNTGSDLYINSYTDAGTFLNQPITIQRSSGNVGIHTSTPAQKLDVNGTTRTTGFQMTNGAVNGYFLQSDASGNASWVAPTIYIGGTGINVSGTTITNTAPDQTVTLTGSGATTVTGTYPNFTVSSTDANTTYNGGTGINVSGTTITNTAPDQTVTLTGSGATTVTGTYPNFTVSSTDANTTYSGGTGINVSGTTITNTAPDQTVTLTGSGATTVTGTYPNFTVSSTDANTTYTGGTGINVSGTTITNTAPDQTVTLTGTGATTVTGTYPNFTINASSYWSASGSHIANTNSGNVGIGTTLPVNKLDVGGGVAIGTSYSGTSSAPSNGAIIQGNVGIGTTSAVNKLDVEGGVAIGSTYSGTSTAPTNGAIIEGNLGVGTSAPVNKLDVEGGVAIGASYSSAFSAPTNGALIQGIVGIGTNTPVNKLDVEGGVAIGSSFSGLSTAPTNGAIIEGDLGIGTSGPVNKLDVEGGVAIGSTYSGTSSAPSNGAIIQGNVGIGTATPVNKVDIEGSVAIGSSYSGISTAPTNGAIIEGDLGIGTAAPVNKLDVEGGVAIGSTYSGTSSAPSNGALIQGNVGIGTATPVNKVDIEGSVAIGASYSGTSSAPGNGAIIQGNVGIGTASPSEKLEVSGKTKTTFLQLTNGANDGYLLQSDASGNADWVSAADAISSGLTGSNGLTVSESTVKLGGHLTEPTIIFTDGSFLEFNGTLGSNSTGPSQTSDNAFLSDLTSVYQSFTTGSGIGSRAYLTAIALKTNASGLSDPSATLNIYSGTGTSGILLGTGAITISGSNSSGTIITYNLSTPVAISPSTTYTFEIVLNVTPTFRWIFYSNTNPYGNGQSSISNSDFYFVTYYATYSSLLYLEAGNDRVGIGTATTINKLDVEGGVAIGSSYSGTSTAPSNGALIEGNVGIGTTSTTQAKLVVNGSQNTNIGGFGYLNDNGNTGTTSGTNSYSIYASNRVAASEFNAFSDARIKNILGVSDSRADLQTLMGIEITDYKLKDHIAKGSAEYKKVIAQQVEQVYPQAVSKMTDVVPDIYQLAEIHQGYVAVANTLKVGEKVKLIFGERSEVLEVIAADANGFKVNSPEEGKVFVYGREVGDFRTVDYEALSTLNISATQELVKMIRNLESKNSAMEQTVLELKAENQAIKSDIERIKAALQLNAEMGRVGD